MATNQKTNKMDIARTNDNKKTNTVRMKDIPSFSIIQRYEELTSISILIKHSVAMGFSAEVYFDVLSLYTTMYS